MGKQLTGAEAARIATEVNHWVEQTQYRPTPEDTTIMKSVAAGVIRVTLYKTVLGAAVGALVGLSLPRMIRSFKLPLSVTTSIGVLAGVASDVANRQRESMSTWLRLQRNVSTPLTDKIYRTAVEVAPLSDEGRIARAWLDQQTALPLPSSSPATDNGRGEFIPTPLSTTMPPPPLITNSPRRPGSGFYDLKRGGPRPSEDPHRPGTGFYDVTQSAGTAGGEGRFAYRPGPQSDGGSYDEVFPPVVDSPKPTPVARPLVARPLVTRAQNREPAAKTKPNVNQYGDEIISTP